MAVSEDLEIIQGKTFNIDVCCETLPFIYKPITGISKAAPCVITSAGHGLPDGWRVAVVSTRGMDQLRAKAQPPKRNEYRRATVISNDTVELNDVNASGYNAYVSGGYLQFYTPVLLNGMTARMAIKTRVGGAVIAMLTTENGGIAIDVNKYTVTINITAEATAAFKTGERVYDLELVGPNGVVWLLMYGAAIVSPEVTT